MAHEERTIKVTGMGCSRCEETLRSSLLELPGILEVRADHRAGNVSIRYGTHGPPEKEINEKIREAGFEPLTR